MVKNVIYIILIGVFTLPLNAQEIEGTELGIDGTFSATSGYYNSGTFGIGMKYGMKFGENVILGPSARYQLAWANNNTTGNSSRYNIFGGGAFIHGRFANILFAGVEFELLRSPYTNNGYLTNSQGKWVATCLLGGGFSKEFNESWRLNAGVYYDILDVPNPSNPSNLNPNSPLQPYMTKNKQTGLVIPILYRIAVFFPLS